MKKGGDGGRLANKSGSEFEKNNSLSSLISRDNRFSYELLQTLTSGKSIEKPFNVFYEGSLLAKTFHQNQIYKDYFEKENVYWGDHFVKEIKPDVFIINYVLKKCFVIEMKYQEKPGSVDEKLQSFQFKIDYFKKIISKSKSLYNFDFEYIYLLNDWFYSGYTYKNNYENGLKASSRKGKSQYLDTLEYLSRNDIKHFNDFPLNYILLNDLENS